MTTMTPDSYIFQCLEKEEGISVAPEQCSEVEAHARAVMARSALKRLADPSFPPELRLQVMKWGVSFGNTCWYLAHGKTMKDLRNAASNSLLPLLSDHSHLHNSAADQQTYSIIKDAAEHAFLGNVTFKTELFRSMTMHNETSSIANSLLLGAIAAHIHYLDMSACVVIGYGSKQVIQPGHSCREITKSMGSLKGHFPNLKTCILTLDIRKTHKLVTNSIKRFDQRPLRKVKTVNGCDDRSELAIEIAELFEAFARRGPGRFQFIRIRCIRAISVCTYVGVGYKSIPEPFSYGPLVKVDRTAIMETETQNKSLGRRLLADAYRLARTGPRLVREEYKN